MRLSYRVLPLFLTLEAILYAAFLIWDVTIGGRGSNPIKFAGILLCLIYSLYLSHQGGSRLVSAALTLTVLADVFLLLLDAHYALGIVLFCLVQGLYFVRIYRSNGGRSLWGLRAALFVLALVVLNVLDLLIPLNILALFYFTNFFCNALSSLSCPGQSMAPVFCGSLALSLLRYVCGPVPESTAGSPGGKRFRVGGDVAVLSPRPSSHCPVGGKSFFRRFFP